LGQSFTGSNKSGNDLAPKAIGHQFPAASPLQPPMCRLTHVRRPFL
jgi:hypothetical protein